jgi:hypothetical protein
MISWLMVLFLVNGTVVTVPDVRDYNSCWGLASATWVNYNNHYSGQSADLTDRDFVCQPYYSK